MSLFTCILLAAVTALVVECKLLAPRPFRPEFTVVNEWLEKAEFIKKYYGSLKTIDPKTTFNILAEQATYLSSVQGNRTLCVEALAKWTFDLIHKERYALQALDSFGKVESGILSGNIKWYGQYYECLKIHQDLFDGQWCGANFGPPSYNPYMFSPSLLIGTCLPDACSQEFVNELLRSAVRNKTLPFTVECPKQLIEWTTMDIVSLVVILFFSLLLTTGSVLDLFICFRERRKKKELSVNGDGFLTGNLYNQPQEPSRLSKIFLAFSIQRNTKILLDTSSKPGNIEVIHGVRFFSICWIVLGHTYVYIGLHISNFLELTDSILYQESFQIIGNATFSVDAFFLLSGVLVTYLNLRMAEKSNGRIKIPLMYLNRYLRLTPAYAMVILVAVGMYSKLGEGPVWPGSTTQQSDICRSYWWTNMLYINNFHPVALQNECISWSWYLANDMQFFLLAPIFIVLLIKKPKAGVLSLIFGIFCGLLSTAVISVHYKEQPQVVTISQFLKFQLNRTNKNFNFSHGRLGILPNMSSSDVFWSDIYAKPWCRMSVYFIGMLTGYILHVTRCRIRFHKLFVAFGWMMSAVIYLSLLFGLYHLIESGSAMSVSAAAFYNAVSRPVWSLALAWLIIMCACGYGGFISSVLSFKLFVPLSRLTYCIYLVHPLVLIWMATNRPTDIVYSNTEFAFYFLSCLLLSISLSYIIYMLVEQPMIVLQKMLTSRQEPDNSLPSEEITRSLIEDHTVVDRE